MPRHRYGPASLDLGFNPINPKPPINEGGGSGILPRMREHFAGNFGVVMFYCMTSRAYTIKVHGTIISVLTRRRWKPTCPT